MELKTCLLNLTANFCVSNPVRLLQALDHCCMFLVFATEQ